MERRRMERLGVGRRRYPNGGNGERYLHALSPQNLSHIPERDLDLFFLQSNRPILTTNCRGLLCFDSMDGRTVVCNPTTQELKFLPPTPRPTPRRPGGLARKSMIASCLGYDATCDDYKVLRSYRIYFYTLCEDGTEVYNGSCLPKFELYSLRLNSWREIPNPETWPILINPLFGCAFVNGSIYWIARNDRRVWEIVIFNFATETFSWLSLPQHPPDSCFYLVNIDALTLGVVIYQRLRDGLLKLFKLWVLRQGCWTPLYNNGVYLYDVERLVGLKYGNLLFLGRRRRTSDLEQLVVYDWITNELKELEIYDHSHSMMQIISYVESRVALPNAMPIGCYDDEASWDEYWRRYEDEVNQVTGSRLDEKQY